MKCSSNKQKTLLHSCLNARNKATAGSKNVLQLYMNNTSFVIIHSYKADIRYEYIVFSHHMQSKIYIM